MWLGFQESFHLPRAVSVFRPTSWKAQSESTRARFSVRSSRSPRASRELALWGAPAPSELMSSEQQSQEGHPRSAAYGSAKRSPLCFWFFWSICKITSDLFSWHVVSHGSSETPRIRDAGDGALSPSRVPCGLAQQARVGWWQSSGKHRFSWFSQPVFWFVKMCAKATGSPAYVLLCSEATFIVSN